MIGLAWVRAVRSFRNAVVPVSTPTWTRHKAKVKTISPLTVDLGDGTGCPAHCLAGYTPVANDVVWVDNLDGDIVIHNKFSS